MTLDSGHGTGPETEPEHAFNMQALLHDKLKRDLFEVVAITLAEIRDELVEKKRALVEIRDILAEGVLQLRAIANKLEEQK